MSKRKKPRKGSTKATGRKYTYDKEYQKKKAKYRAELNAYNRAKGTYGNGDGLDASHKNGVISGFEPAAVNRARKK